MEKKIHNDSEIIFDYSDKRFETKLTKHITGYSGHFQDKIKRFMAVKRMKEVNTPPILHGDQSHAARNLQRKEFVALVDMRRTRIA